MADKNINITTTWSAAAITSADDVYIFSGGILSTDSAGNEAKSIRVGNNKVRDTPSAGTLKIGAGNGIRLNNTTGSGGGAPNGGTIEIETGGIVSDRTHASPTTFDLQGKLSVINTGLPSIRGRLVVFDGTLDLLFTRIDATASEFDLGLYKRQAPTTVSFIPLPDGFSEIFEKPPKVPSLTIEGGKDMEQWLGSRLRTGEIGFIEDDASYPFLTKHLQEEAGKNLRWWYIGPKHQLKVRLLDCVTRFVSPRSVRRATLSLKESS